MFRIKIEKFDLQVEQSGYNKEVNRIDVFEQVLEQLDVNQIANFINSNPGVNS